MSASSCLLMNRIDADVCFLSAISFGVAICTALLCSLYNIPQFLFTLFFRLPFLQFLSLQSLLSGYTRFIKNSFKMKPIIAIAYVAGANALTTRWASCCFHIDASGAVTGTVGQLDDGQTRVNGPLAAAEFCIANSEITDSEGRGCFFTRRLTRS